MTRTLRLNSFFFVFLSTILVSGCSSYKPKIDTSSYTASHSTEKFKQPDGWQEKEVRNVIFMIGDGMGINQIFLSRFIALGKEKRLNMERMPITGLVTTYSSSSIKTDSAAAATALATGVKTNNKMISQLPDGTKMVTLLEKAEEKGIATGLIATKAITDATPAGFSAHNVSRDNQTEIAANILANNIEIIFGGGRKYWLPESADGSRKDGRNLVSEAKAKGYTYAATRDEFININRLPVLGLFHMKHMNETSVEPSIEEMTRKSLGLLQNHKDGFFLMVEGSQIDTECHWHDEAEFIRRVLLFDAAVKTAIDFAQKDGHTLVIVTADHETGGMMLLEDGPHWATLDHSASPVAIFAYGPGSELFVGMHDNTELPRIIAKLLGFTNFPAKLK
ncbi:MAG: alkaline phosphatase [SAR324 cluster bacterium]|nr:alkaline phosphatase [SAR324 cluster bacterium]